jgi:hypothetical protein
MGADSDQHGADDQIVDVGRDRSDILHLLISNCKMSLSDVSAIMLVDKSASSLVKDIGVRMLLVWMDEAYLPPFHSKCMNGVRIRDVPRSRATRFMVTNNPTSAMGKTIVNAWTLDAYTATRMLMHAASADAVEWVNHILKNIGDKRPDPIDVYTIKRMVMWAAVEWCSERTVEMIVVWHGVGVGVNNNFAMVRAEAAVEFDSNIATQGMLALLKRL